MAKEKEKLTEELVMNQVGKILEDYGCDVVSVEEVRIPGGGLSTILQRRSAGEGADGDWREVRRRVRRRERRVYQVRPYGGVCDGGRREV